MKAGHSEGSESLVTKATTEPSNWTKMLHIAIVNGGVDRRSRMAPSARNALPFSTPVPAVSLQRLVTSLDFAPFFDGSALRGVPFLGAAFRARGGGDGDFETDRRDDRRFPATPLPFAVGDATALLRLVSTAIAPRDFTQDDAQVDATNCGCSRL